MDDQEEEYKRQLADDERAHNLWRKVQKKVDELHEACADMRANLNDSAYNPNYDKKRELVLFFGITAKIWKSGHSPRFEIQCNPPDIMSLIS